MSYGGPPRLGENDRGRNDPQPKQTPYGNTKDMTPKLKRNDVVRVGGLK